MLLPIALSPGGAGRSALQWPWAVELQHWRPLLLLGDRERRGGRSTEHRHRSTARRDTAADNAAVASKRHRMGTTTALQDFRAVLISKAAIRPMRLKTKERRRLQAGQAESE